jgi:hypothetical protein
VAAAPAIPYLILGLAALVSLMVAVGLQKGYSYTFALMFVKLAETAEKVRIPTTFHTFRPLKPLGDALRWVNRVIFAMLGVWIATSERGVSYFFSALAQIVNWGAHEIAQLAKSAFSMGRGILLRVHHLMKQYVKAIVLPLIHIVVHRLILGIKRQLHLIRVRIQALRHGVIHLYHLSLGAVRFLRKQLLRRLLHLERGLTHRITALARRVWTMARLRQLFRSLLNGVKWNARVASALGRLGLGWLRSSNVMRFGKFLMRQGLDWIDMLLALITPVAGTMSLREFAYFMVDAEDEIKQATTRFWQVDA